MSEPLPAFRYHPDPVASGAVRAGPETCACCSRARGYVYCGPVHGPDEMDDFLCPWCIEEGSAAEKFGVSFVDTWALESAGIAPRVIDEIRFRTPGYESWQPLEWLSHCGDACAFHWDFTAAELRDLPEDVRAPVMQANGLSDSDWSRLVQQYEPGGDPAFYRFVCLHCGAVRAGMDCS